MKLDLVRSRGVLTREGYRPVCAVCGEPIFEDPEMHEAILTRAMWESMPQQLIMVEENCVLVHPGGKNAGTCHEKAHTASGQELSIRHILNYVDLEDVVAWLRRMDLLARHPEIEGLIRKVRDLAV